MKTTRSKVREIVSEELETGTNALVDEEVSELAEKIADRITAQFDDVADDSDECCDEETQIDDDVDE